MFHLHCQIWQAAHGLCYRWAIQHPMLCHSVILLPPHCQTHCVCCPCFLIRCVPQRSATIWLWMLCVQKPGLRLSTRKIKVIVGLPRASPSKTERKNVWKRSSWCRQVLWSLWCTHGFSDGFLSVGNQPQSYMFSHVSKTQHSHHIEVFMFIHESYILGLLEKKIMFWARKKTGQSCERSYAEQEDLGSNMKQTPPDQSMQSTTLCCSEWWIICRHLENFREGERMRKRKERMEVKRKTAKLGVLRMWQRFLQVDQQTHHRLSITVQPYVTTTQPTVNLSGFSRNVTFKATWTKFLIPAVHCSNGFLWLAAPRRDTEELISGNSCCCCVCRAWILGLF